MMDFIYTPSFLRQYKKLVPTLRVEVKEKINLFINNPSHPSLKVHKLKGRLKGTYSFSVNYSYRIVFEYLKDNTVLLLSVGDHSIYQDS